jgi:predicted transcriptional regulator
MGCNVPQYSLKLCTYDPAIIDAFERLRINRKQAAFTHEALKYFLTSEKGVQIFSLMGGSNINNLPSITYTSITKPGVEESKEQNKIFQLSTSKDSLFCQNCLLIKYTHYCDN